MIRLNGFSEDSAEKDPFVQFDRWYREHLSEGIAVPDSFTLATSGKDGMVSARTVLLKEYNDAGFVFFTNYGSRKGTEIALNPNVAMLFYWTDPSRQVRIEGRAVRVQDSESDKYFSSRPRESRIGAWASNQDTIIPNREYLDKRFRDYDRKFSGGDVPRPPYWGGYRVLPSVFEFWQEGDNRLHDRLLYKFTSGTWKISRLSP